jgi:hypothetical protein
MDRHMPEVDLDRDIQACFAEARKMSAGGVYVPGGVPGERYVTVITPGRMIVPISCPAPKAGYEEKLATLRSIVPPEPKRAITVIAFNDLVMHMDLESGITIELVKSLIPFFSWLRVMAFDGHTVVVFEGHPSALKVGCQNSDVLIADQSMVDHLQEDWVFVASTVMRHPWILVVGRDGSIAEVNPSTRPPRKAEGL